MSILRRHAPLLNITQRILDVAILLFVTWVAEERFDSPEFMKVSAIYGSLLVVFIFSLFNMYKSWRGVSISNQIKILSLAWVCVLAVFNILILLLSDKEQLAKLWPYGLFRFSEFLLWSLFVFLGLVTIRLAAKLLLMFFRKKGYNQRRAVIVGAGEAGTTLAKYLAEKRWMGIKFIGFFDDRFAEGVVMKGSPEVLGPILGTIQQCPQLSLDKGIDMVFVALPMRAEKKINKLIWALGTSGVAVFLVPDLFVFGIQKAKVHQMGELHVIDLNLFRPWKRVFDIFFSIIIIILTLPVWLVIVALIKMEDGGPIFFRHTRVMECGKGFSCLKFRTMHIKADEKLKNLLEQDQALREEWERAYKLKNDPRVTKVGRILRKTSLDELPQFLNVLAGQMSVVGARPVVPEELIRYYKGTALTYCATKPGITGPWQTGKRNDTEHYEEREKLDRWYVLNSSIWLDTRIIFKTIWSMLTGRGAY